MAQARLGLSAYTQNKAGNTPLPDWSSRKGSFNQAGFRVNQAPLKRRNAPRKLPNKSPPHSQGGGLFLYDLCLQEKIMFKIGLVQNNPKFLKSKENAAAALE